MVLYFLIHYFFCFYQLHIWSQHLYHSTYPSPLLVSPISHTSLSTPFHLPHIFTCLWMYVHISTNMHIDIYAIDWICSISLMCICPTMTVWYWTTYDRAHSWRILILLLSATIDLLNPMNKINDWMSKMFKLYNSSTFILELTIRFPSIIKDHKNRRKYRPGTVNFSKYPWLEKTESLEENRLLPISISCILSKQCEKTMFLLSSKKSKKTMLLATGMFPNLVTALYLWGEECNFKSVFLCPTV